MPSYFNYLTLEDEDISTAKTCYLICLNQEHQTYKLCVSPNALNELQYDPLTRATQYWPITQEQMEQADKAIWVIDEKVRTTPFSLGEIQSCFDFNPQSTPAINFVEQEQSMAERVHLDRDAPPPTFSQEEARRLLDRSIALGHMDSASHLAARTGLFRANNLIFPDLPDFPRFTTREMENSMTTLLTRPDCIQALQEEVLSMDDIARMGSDPSVKLTTACISGLRERLFSATDIVDKDVSFIHALTRDTCLNALREGRADIQQLRELTVYELYEANRTENYLSPPRLS